MFIKIRINFINTKRIFFKGIMVLKNFSFSCCLFLFLIFLFVILFSLTCSFEGFFVSKIQYISFKTKSGIFLTPISLPTSFIVFVPHPISLVYFIVRNSTFAFLYPSSDIKYILYITQEKNKYFLIT